MKSKLVRSAKSGYIGKIKKGMMFGHWKVTSSVIWKRPDRKAAVRCLCLRCHKTRQYIDIFKLTRGKTTGCIHCSPKNLGPTIGPIPNSLITQWKNGAVDRNLSWSITNQDLLDLYNRQNGKCALSNELLTFKSGKIKGNTSLDRIDSSRGYEVGNIQFVTKEINFAKQSLSQSDFIELCRKVTYAHDARII